MSAEKWKDHLGDPALEAIRCHDKNREFAETLLSSAAPSVVLSDQCSRKGWAPTDLSMRFENIQMSLIHG